MADEYTDEAPKDHEDDNDNGPRFDAAEEDGDDAPVNSKFAKKVVNELYERYNTLRERKSAYIDLVIFLVYVSFNLSILYLQRDATAAYSVVSTITRSGLIPEDQEVSDIQYILDWMQGTLENIWTDPVCGDDKCEEPFEFAFYGRFGCKADCGTYLDLQDVTSVQIDLYFDFHHASGSTPATTLMQDAKWNLCPTEDSSFFDVYNIGRNTSDIKHGSACYYEEYQGFDMLEGHTKIVIDDVPDGEWQIVAKNDLFRKVKGAVRTWAQVDALSTHLKIYHLSEAVAAYELGREWYILNATLQEMKKDDLTVIQESLWEIKADADAAILLTNLTGGYNSTEEFNIATNALELQWTESLAAAQSVLDTECKELALSNSTLLIGSEDNVTGAVYCGMNNYCFSTDYQSPELIWEGQFNITMGLNASLCNCSSTIDEFCAWAELAVDAHQQGIRNTLLSLRKNMASQSDVLYKDIMTYYEGTNIALQYEISIDVGKDLNKPGAVAASYVVDELLANAYDVSKYEDNLSDYKFANEKFSTLTLSVENRTMEFEDELSSYATRMYHYGMTHQQLLDTIADKDANATLYTLVEWAGSTTEYKRCELFNRAKEYAGACVSMTKIDAIVADQILLEGEPSGTKASEKKQECNELCYCEPEVLGGVQCDVNSTLPVCACEMCGMAEDEMDDLLAPPASVRHRLRRALLQTDEEMYAALLKEIQDLSTQQSTLYTKVEDVSFEQSRQNEAAELHHADTTLKDTITNGFDDLQTSYEVLQTQMDELLEKQDQALASQEAALANQQRTLALVEQQVASQDAINRAVQRQLSEIEAAFKAGQINEDQERQYRWKAYLDETKAEKDAALSNMPCEITPASYQFELANHNRSTINAARERLVGINNRVVAGMLLYSRRNELGNCTTSRFSNIENECIKGLDAGHSYGVDPVFKLGTTLYDPDLDYEETITKYYNCTDLENGGTYPANSTYKVPYCAELFNEKLVPYGFHYLSMKSYSQGFPVFFDINLSADRAQAFYLYLEEGHYIEEAESRDVAVQMVTYNAELRTFANIKIRFDFTVAGKIEISHSIQAVRVELYETSEDYIRLAMEIVLAIGSIVALALELLELFESQQKYGTVQAYFRSAWNYVDVLSISIQIACVVIWWWSYVYSNASQFSVSEKPGGRYDVYADLDARANYLRLAGNCYSVVPDSEDALLNEQCDPNLVRGEAIHDLSDMLSDMEKCGATLSEYMTLSGINIILMIARSLKLMDFQPRLGIVTKTLSRAASDILHFMVVFGVVFMGYVMMGTLVFGYKIEEFSSLEKSLRTCFETLLGEIGWNSNLQVLEGLEYWAGFAYFWSYQILVFMILLNFLLAIIVDAYAEIKEEAHETVSVPAEVIPMLKEKWRSITKSKYFYRKHIPEERIRKSLKVLAGRGDEESDSDDTVDFEVNPEKVLKVGEEDIDKETLRRVLQHCIAYAEEKAGVYDLQPEKEKIKKKSGIMGTIFGATEEDKSMPPLFTAQDVNGAVDMLISQHGEVKQKAKDDDDEDEEDADVKELMEKMQELIKGQDDLMRGQKKLEELEERLLKVIELPGGY
mmetsp:Transcript_38784/g.53872  ORF Transcript_38784/g.53872 Transcript_38784/m.53872 type:complete len:1579 (-) Transcript_38784:245-4981(-)|eukprot:CAMPEP_0196576950 /NCGR_PEP_ID=MMETSP1081-20130531/6092_1 /TAXON_ID=36882 /ORGANISM="Pyramimonas amylifera, Strain CCMP720" /LENGTH=1578 /DNA_ID=CAMNT_0041895699 /DNA_START=201 /DNA_END=4937 /DNA_ORIENTATION=+